MSKIRKALNFTPRKSLEPNLKKECKYKNVAIFLNVNKTYEIIK